MSAVAPSQTQSRVHSASCIKDGKVICACDKPVSKLLSRTERNPGRVFYKCYKCNFFKWEDELLRAGLIPSEDPSHTNLPHGQQHQQQHGNNDSVVSFPTTPQKPSPNFPITPPRTQVLAKRTFTTMSTKSGLKRKPSELLSEEERARRMTNIEAGLRGEVKEEDDERRYILESPPPRLSNVPTQPVSHILLDSDTEGQAEGADDGEEEEEEPANKRLRFADHDEASFQLQLPTTPTRASSASHSFQLPTPDTSEREVSAAVHLDELFDDAVPPSPTSFTRAGRRASEREKARLSGESEEPVLFRDKGKSRAVESIHDRVSTITNGEHEAGPSGIHRGEGFAAELGSLIARANWDTSSAASYHRRRSISHTSTLSDPLGRTTLEIDLRSALLAVEKGLEKALAEKVEWQRRATNAERQLEKLQDENKELKEKFVKLEEIFNPVREARTMPSQRSN